MSCRPRVRGRRRRRRRRRDGRSRRRGRPARGEAGRVRARDDLDRRSRRHDARARRDARGDGAVSRAERAASASGDREHRRSKTSTRPTTLVVLDARGRAARRRSRPRRRDDRFLASEDATRRSRVAGFDARARCVVPARGEPSPEHLISLNIRRERERRSRSPTARTIDRSIASRGCFVEASAITRARASVDPPVATTLTMSGGPYGGSSLASVRARGRAPRGRRAAEPRSPRVSSRLRRSSSLNIASSTVRARRPTDASRLPPPPLLLLSRLSSCASARSCSASVTGR